MKIKINIELDVEIDDIADGISITNDGRTGTIIPISDNCNGLFDFSFKDTYIDLSEVIKNKTRDIVSYNYHRLDFEFCKKLIKECIGESSFSDFDIIRTDKKQIKAVKNIDKWLVSERMLMVDLMPSCEFIYDLAFGQIDGDKDLGILFQNTLCVDVVGLFLNAFNFMTKTYGKTGSTKRIYNCLTSHLNNNELNIFVGDEL